ncbi:MAG: sulfide/dihydroorotate dehydrogenase-like FAD/NAD-binding protein, partial [Oscillospiraceae bacterium]
PIMVDGTGMCGGCRVTVGGKIKYACVDGPDFDGHQVDFDELMKRNSTYKEQEAAHICRLTGGMR